jgi:squalene-hopene/tetraprenyl-beta-curcumene cyclase
MTRLLRRLWPALAAVVLLTGCGGQPPNSSPGAAALEPGRPQSRLERIDAALRAAAGFLLSAQSADGSWKSEVYGQFKEGDALTPIVLVTLLDLPETPHSPEAIERGAKYLRNFIADEGTIHPIDPITYPVYMAAGAAIALNTQDDTDSRAASRAWIKFLRNQQLTESLGWQPDDAQFGGWSYSKELPHKPPAGEPLSPLAEPNLSATVFALDALRACGATPDDHAIQEALKFIERCQNHSDKPDAADNRFDDGGFFFIQGDSLRNKAGLNGVDQQGKTRYSSYGSTTADGLRGLLDCGLQPDHPRVAAALRWLKTNFAADKHPGQYAADRRATQDALYFYYCASCGKAFSAAAKSNGGAALPDDWAESLPDALLARQSSDGSWSNPVVDGREDDPLVATCFAASALATCRGTLAEASGHTTCRPVTARTEVDSRDSFTAKHSP